MYQNQSFNFDAIFFANIWEIRWECNLPSDDLHRFKLNSHSNEFARPTILFYWAICFSELVCTSLSLSLSRSVDFSVQWYACAIRASNSHFNIFVWFIACANTALIAALARLWSEASTLKFLKSLTNVMKLINCGGRTIFLQSVNWIWLIALFISLLNLDLDDSMVRSNHRIRTTYW